MPDAIETTQTINTVDPIPEPTSEPATRSTAANTTHPGITGRAILLALVPLALLAAVIAVIVVTDAGLGDRKTPPIETINVQRVVLPEPGVIELSVVNDGPDPITIAQVRVDDAYWQFEMDPAGELGRADSATITIPYP